MFSCGTTSKCQTEISYALCVLYKQHFVIWVRRSGDAPLTVSLSDLAIPEIRRTLSEVTDFWRGSSHGSGDCSADLEMDSTPTACSVSFYNCCPFDIGFSQSGVEELVNVPAGSSRCAGFYSYLRTTTYSKLKRVVGVCEARLTCRAYQWTAAPVLWRPASRQLRICRASSHTSERSATSAGSAAPAWSANINVRSPEGSRESPNLCYLLP